jgi:hypothetical protein
MRRSVAWIFLTDFSPSPFRRSAASRRLGKSSKGQQEQLSRILAHAQPLTDEELAKIDDDDEAFRVQLKRFFENAPLYRAWPLPGTEVRTGGSLSTGRWNRELDHVEVPESFRIEMPCPLCGPPSRTFVLDWRDKYGKPDGVTLEVDEGPHLVCFKCTHCDKKRIGYLVYLGRNTDTRALQMEMGGVYPSARPEPAPELANGLGDAKGRRTLDTRKTKARFVQFLAQYSKGFFDGEAREPVHTQVTPKTLPAIATAIYNARSGYLHNGDPMYISRGVPSFPGWHMDPSVGMRDGERKFVAKEKLPYIVFAHRLIRYCLLAYIRSLVPGNRKRS